MQTVNIKKCKNKKKYDLFYTQNTDEKEAKDKKEKKRGEAQMTTTRKMKKIIQCDEKK